MWQKYKLYKVPRAIHQLHKRHGVHAHLPPCRLHVWGCQCFICFMIRWLGTRKRACLMCSSTSGIGTDENDDSENDDMKKMNQRRERKMMTRIRMRMRNQSPTMAWIREGIDNPQMLPLFLSKYLKMFICCHPAFVSPSPFEEKHLQAKEKQWMLDAKELTTKVELKLVCEIKNQETNYIITPN